MKSRAIAFARRLAQPLAIWQTQSNRLRGASWVQLATVFSFSLAALSLVAAWHLSNVTNARNAEAAVITEKTRALVQLSEPAALTTGPEVIAKTDSQYTKDLSALFKTAKASLVNIGVVDYKSESLPGGEYLVRTVDLRLNDEYPRIKNFISNFLDTTLNASLQEIRIERSDAMSEQATMLIRFAFIYRKNEGQMK